MGQRDQPDDFKYIFQGQGSDPGPAESSLPAYRIRGQLLADCKLRIQIDDKKGGTVSKIHTLWEFRRPTYNNNKESLRVADISNHILEHALDAFLKTSTSGGLSANDKPTIQKPYDNVETGISYTDICEYKGPFKAGQFRECTRPSLNDVKQAVKDMIRAGMNDLTLFIRFRNRKETQEYLQAIRPSAKRTWEQSLQGTYDVADALINASKRPKTSAQSTPGSQQRAKRETVLGPNEPKGLESDFYENIEGLGWDEYSGRGPQFPDPIETLEYGQQLVDE
jgi:hypothetical protein